MENTKLPTFGYETTCFQNVLWLCHDLKEILWVTIFFFIIIKYDNYVSGTGAQFLLMVDSKLH